MKICFSKNTISELKSRKFTLLQTKFARGGSEIGCFVDGKKMKNNNNKRFVTLNTMYVQSKLKNETVLYNYSRINSDFERKRIDHQPSSNLSGLLGNKSRFIHNRNLGVNECNQKFF